MMAFQTHLDTPSSSLLKPDQDLASILDPSYRTGSRQRQRGSSASSCTGTDGNASCPSLKHLPGTPSSEASAHDPEFRPFMTPLTTINGSSTIRPRITHLSSSRYYDPAHSAPPTPGQSRAPRIRSPLIAGNGTVEHFVPPTREQRDAARLQLTPSLHDALEATEKRASRRWVHTHGNASHGHKRRHRWLRRRGHSEPMSSLEESPVTATITTPPVPLIPTHFRPDPPETTESGSAVLTYDGGPGTPGDASSDDDTPDSGYSHASHGFRQRVASISLKVDLALFRAKKRVRQTVRME